MKPERKITKIIKIGNSFIGGGKRILIQSMTNTPTDNYDKTFSQISYLEEKGCDIVRVTVPDMEAVKNISKLKENIHIPIVCDIHFDYKLAIESVFAGADKIRINPGNIGGDENVKKVADACKKMGIPIRVGVNSGSVEKAFLDKYGKRCPEALCDSALDKVKMLERFDFDNIVVSVKSSSVNEMIMANRLISERCDYPLHLGVTEAGTYTSGIIKSSIGIGALLSEGIGDTIRVSLTTSDLADEIKSAKRILDACEITENAISLVSCPTCGRTKIDIVGIANELENKISKLGLKPKRNIKVAVMGCAVNGPGEAKDADIGIAGGNKEALLFKKGVIVGKFPEDKILDILIKEIKYIVEAEDAE